MIDELYYDLSTALDTEVGFDSNNYIKPATDLTCQDFYDAGIDDSIFTSEICDWFISKITTELICYMDYYYEYDYYDPELELECSEITELGCNCELVQAAFIEFLSTGYLNIDAACGY